VTTFEANFVGRRKRTRDKRTAQRVVVDARSFARVRDAVLDEFEHVSELRVAAASSTIAVLHRAIEDRRVQSALLTSHDVAATGDRARADAAARMSLRRAARETTLNEDALARLIDEVDDGALVADVVDALRSKLSPSNGGHS